MPSRIARRLLTQRGWARAGRSVGLAACVVLFGSHGLQNAAANGDTRTISFRHLHTGEVLTVTYKRDGRYDQDALRKIDHQMRDWRRNEAVRMDPRVIDIIWEVNRDVGGRRPIEIICGYRAPATNSMLRQRSRGVAQFSQHTLGKAVDFAIPGVPLEQIRNAGLRLQRGGVGFYPTSGSPFVHLDIGGVRHWPRMTHDQLARVFPDGRTVHVPSNGRPLAGYSLALADVQKRGSSPSPTSVDAATAGAKPKRNLLTALFGGGKDEDEDSAAANPPAAPSSRARAATQPAAPETTASATGASPRVRNVATVVVPLPTARPRVPKADTPTEPAFVLASAEANPSLFDPAPSAPPDNVFAARGLWEGPQGRPEPPAPIPTQPAVSDAIPSLAPARAERPVAGQATGAVARWPGKPAPDTDRAAGDAALAYAARNSVPATTPVTRAAPPMGKVAARPPQDGVTTIAKRSSPRTTSVAAAAPPPTRAPTPAAAATSSAPALARTRPAALVGATYEDPWLRAIVLAPDLNNYLTVTAFEPPDLTHLRAMMLKPNSVVMMTFSNNPHLGMTAERFSGSAVVFVSTVTFTSRTAALAQ